MANESEWSTWKNHEVYEVDLLGDGFSVGVDISLGVVLFLCGLIGFPANVVSFIYFINRTTTNISLKLRKSQKKKSKFIFQQVIQLIHKYILLNTLRNIKEL